MREKKKNDAGFFITFKNVLKKNILRSGTNFGIFKNKPYRRKIDYMADFCLKILSARSYLLLFQTYFLTVDTVFNL